MACSDNVVRAGLTPKYKDVNTLCSMLTYKCWTPEQVKFTPSKITENIQTFTTPVKDFAVEKIQVSLSEVV